MSNYKEPEPQGFTEEQINNFNLNQEFKNIDGRPCKPVLVSSNKKGVYYLTCQKLSTVARGGALFTQYIDVDEQGKPFIYVYNYEKMYL